MMCFEILLPRGLSWRCLLAGVFSCIASLFANFIVGVFLVIRGGLGVVCLVVRGCGFCEGELQGETQGGLDLTPGEGGGWGVVVDNK